MAEFLPFRGLRYRVTADRATAEGGDDLSAVAAPPYDVIDDELRARLEATDPYNSVQLILPQPDGPQPDGPQPDSPQPDSPQPDGGSADPYEAAARRLAAWRAAGVLAADDHAAFYGYRMTFFGEDANPRRTSGVLGALHLPPPGTQPGDAGILPHERTLPKARTDRLALLRATRANLDPIWGLSLAAGLTELLAIAGPPLASATDAEGVRHELWRLDDPAVLDAVTSAVSGAPVVLADGHHRFETACNYRAERVEASAGASAASGASGAADPGSEAIMALVVELAEDQLCVRAIHRLVHGAPADLRTRLREDFDVRDAGANRPESVAELERRMHAEGGLGLVDATGLALLVPRSDALAAALAEHPEPLPTVDATCFDVGIRSRLGDATLSYRNDAATVAALVDKGAADAAVLLRAVTVAQIREAAFARIRMPEKTTFFEPKPRTGMVFRSLDD